MRKHKSITPADLELSNLFSFFSDDLLLESVAKPATKAWRHQALIEIFRRTSYDIQFFQANYIDAMLKHHTIISREKFIAILNAAGFLQRWHQLPIDKSSLLFGAVCASNPFIASSILARVFSDVGYKMYDHFGKYKQYITNVVISLYCLAQNDDVRDYLVHQLPRKTDKFSLGFLQALQPFLTDDHRAYVKKRLSKQQLQKLVPEALPAKDPHKKTHAMTEFREFAARCVYKKGPWSFPEEKGIDSLNYLMRHLISEEQKLKLLRLCIDGKIDSYSLNPHQYPYLLSGELRAIFVRIIPSFASMNLREKLTKQEFSALVKFCNQASSTSDSNYYEIFLLLTIQRQLPFLKKDTVFEALYSFFCKMSPHFYCGCPENFAEDFATLLQILPEGEPFEHLNQTKFAYTQHALMRGLVNASTGNMRNAFPQGSFTESSMKGFSLIPKNLKKYALDLLLEKLKTGNQSALYLIARFASAMTQEQLELFITCFTKKANCSIADLPSNLTEKLYRNWFEGSGDDLDSDLIVDILYVLYELELTYVSNIAIFDLLNDLFMVALKCDLPTSGHRDLSPLFIFIIKYQPLLTKDQTTAVLQRGIIALEQKIIDQYHEHVIAALGKSLKPMHMPLLQEMMQHNINSECQFFKAAASYERPKKPVFQALPVLREAFTSVPGYYDRNKSGYFKAQPSRPFRDMLDVITRMESGSLAIDAGFKRLKQFAEQRHAYNFASVVEDCAKAYSSSMESYLDAVKPKFAH